MMKNGMPDKTAFRNPFDKSNERNTVANDVAINHRAPGKHMDAEANNFSQNYPQSAIAYDRAPQRLSGGNAAPLPSSKAHGYRHQTRDGHLRDSTLGKGHRIGRR